MPDSCQVLPNSKGFVRNPDDSSTFLEFSWLQAPDVNDPNKLGLAQPVKIGVKVDFGEGTVYSCSLDTTVTVHKKESDYAIVYGKPGDGRGRNYFVYYDMEKREPVAKRVFYANPFWTGIGYYPKCDDYEINQSETAMRGMFNEELDWFHDPSEFHELDYEAFDTDDYPEPQPEPDPIPVPTPDPLPDIAEDPERTHDEDQSEDKQLEEKKQTTRTVVTKTSVVKKTVTKPVTQQKRAALPQTGNQGLLVLALGAAISIIGLGLLHKKKA